MVCGRYPKEIRHYEKNLKRKCFRKLKNNVWENKIKWQLILRADCHYHLRLLSFCFFSWVVYVKNVHKKNLIKNKAKELYDFKLKKKVLNGLNRQIEENRDLVKNFRKRSEWNLKRLIFKNWRRYSNFRGKIKIIKNLADNIRGERLIVNYLYVWSQRLGEKVEIEDKFERSRFIYENFLKRKGLNKLKLYANRRRHKKELEIFLTARYEKLLKKKIFSKWKIFCGKKKLHRSLTERIQIFHENYLIKRVLNPWISRYEIVTEEKLIQKNLNAEEFYRKKLLINFFRKWGKFTAKKKSEKILTMKYLEFYKTSIIRFYLEKFRKSLTEKIYFSALESRAVNFRQEKLIEIYFGIMCLKVQEKKENELKFSNAIIYYENNLLYKHFQNWLVYLMKKREKIKKIDQINFYYEAKLKEKILNGFNSYLTLKRKKKSAVNFYNFNIKLKNFKKWTLYHQRKKIKILKFEIADNRFNQKIIRRKFLAWKRLLDSSREKTSKAVIFYKKKLAKKIFLRWRKFLNGMKFYNLKIASGKLMINNSLLEKFLAIWYEHYEKKIFFTRKIEQLEENRQKKILNCYFLVWKKFYAKKKEIKEKEVFMRDLIPLIMAETYIWKLGSIWEDRRMEREKFKSAVSFDEKLTKRKFFQRWMSFKKWKEEIAVNCENKWRNVDVKRDVEGCLEWSRGADLRSGRKQPLIPNYLMNRMEVCSEPRKRNDETYTVLNPVNKKLPNVDWGNEEIDLSSEAYNFE